MTGKDIAAGAGLIVATSGFIFMLVAADSRQRALLAGGHCAKVTEALYTPPPMAHTSCYGQDGQHNCTTWYSQSDPYMRSLWRCIDPDSGNRVTEFWRRSAEVHGR